MVDVRDNGVRQGGDRFTDYILKSDNPSSLK
jgi:hypothetical protein